MATVQREITLELLSDLATAIRGVTKDILPSLPINVEVVARPRPSIVITVDEDANPVYGHIIKANLAWIRPSQELRRRQPNLPERIRPSRP